jgi:hypothetical protein
MPSGGVQTGAGGAAPTSDGPQTGILALAGPGLIGTGVLAARRRRATAQIDR